MVKEAAAANDIEQLFGVALEARLVNGADVGGLEIAADAGGFGEAQGAVRIDGGKRGKVVLSGDQRGCLLHGGLVQRVRDGG